ncbi:hypothetical protein SAMN05421734_101292 [Pelagirhabdus alkalitolerans]|uniref:Uncharacterized protein n=1 Tax=Pelagirhabdus alkalitolerans TaxID=1612202 RepID=A0A1G6GMQ9_9BACI|nr:hypothetical protein [Pelagirhabdus alkalitolerans]SDB83257.1 hypothetical protein SAMN05421734_101292 [Pelagirhabdus alkalitolerans]
MFKLTVFLFSLLLFVSGCDDEDLMAYELYDETDDWIVEYNVEEIPLGDGLHENYSLNIIHQGDYAAIDYFYYERYYENSEEGSDPEDVGALEGTPTISYETDKLDDPTISSGGDGGNQYGHVYAVENDYQLVVNIIWEKDGNTYEAQLKPELVDQYVKD